MKKFSICLTLIYRCVLPAVIGMMASVQSYGQISLNICNNPTNFIYGLTGSGTIYPINVNSAATGAVVKNSTYGGNAPSSSNGLGYNPTNNKFYYFKRNTISAPQEFVAFDPVLNTVTILANCPLPAEIHTGCISVTGLGYYTIDINGNLAYYNIASNSWTTITGNFVDQFGANVTAVIQSQNAGDIVIDGWGSLWIVTSSATNFGVYKLPAPLPTIPVASLTVTRRLVSTTPTPNGNMIAGIAFNPTGQILLSTRVDDRLYVLENNLTTTFKGVLGTADVGNDLTSCNFPLYVLPVIWKDFDVVLKRKNEVQLSWTVMEDINKGFYIEYSTDGSEWIDLGFIPSRNNPNSEETYSFTHINHGDGKQYYRIRQVSPNDAETVTEVRAVSLKTMSDGIMIWPNPAKENITISTNKNDGVTQARLFDLSGKLVLLKNLQPGLNNFPVQSLNSGIYILKLSGNYKTYSEKIVIQ